MPAEEKVEQQAATNVSSGATQGTADNSAETIWEKNETAFNSKPFSKFYDPCQELADKSIKCMHRNGGDKDMCQDYFQAYRDCKKEWIAQRRAAKKSWFS